MEAALIIVSCIIAFVIKPYQSGLVDHARSPAGTDCVVTQQWNGWTGEFYTVELYTRKPGGHWSPHYVDHEATHWDRCEMKFDAGGTRLTMIGGDKVERSFDLTVDGQEKKPPFLPAGMK
jgi:hypothetical protein